MNRIYRSIWNQKTGTFIAASEIAQSHGGKASSVAGAVAGRSNGAIEGLALFLLLAFGPNAFALPEGGAVSAGQADIASGIGGMTINQSSQNAAINWQSFNIGAGEAVHFNQPNSSAITLNRVLGSDPSNILGSLSANGNVFLVNPNGVMFGQGAQINVGGLVASTLNITDSDFMAGRFKFSGIGNSVTNQGTITAANGGYVALLGANVSNQGVIAAKLGTVALAAGEAVTLDVAGDGLLNVAVDQGAVNALAENGGLIQADGGQVLMTAQAAGDLLDSAVNNTGIIQARTIENRNGVIKLLGDMDSGTVNVGGTLDASALNGGNGGFIETSAAHVKVADDAHVTTAAANGLTGSWLIDPVDFTIAASGGDMTGAAVSAALAGNNFTIQSTSGGAGTSGDVNVNDTVNWSANRLTLNAQRNININTAMNATGTAQLALEYGQGAVAAGNTGTYYVNAAVNLAAGQNFSTKLGSDGGVKNYTVITALGSEGSTTATDLQGMNGNLTGNYVLGSNIDAAATGAWNGNAGFEPVGDGATSFTGTFDGLGHTISNLSIYRPGTDYVGLFGKADGAIRNVGLVGGSVTGGSSVGGLVADYHSGSISNSYTTGAVIGQNYVGGLVGYKNSGSIGNSYATGAVTGSNSVGGLVGWSYGNISNSYATGSVSGDFYVGGLVGVNDIGSISTSYATGSVRGNDYVGGLTGDNYDTVSNSYATGSVEGNNRVGGLVGENNNTVSTSYATGAVTGSNFVGGLVGRNDDTVSNSYASGSVTGRSYVGGLVGENDDTVSNSYATGSVSGTNFVGGLTGENYDNGSISTSYATGTVSGKVRVGGLVGWNQGNISASYATGAVSGTAHLPYVGGLVGLNGGNISTSYATGSVSGNDAVGGLVGLNGGNISTSFWNSTVNPSLPGIGNGTLTGATGLSTADMKLQASFTPAGSAAGQWDFANTWVIYDTYTTPLLRSFMTALTVTANGGSKTYDGVAGNGASYSVSPGGNLLGALDYGASPNAGGYTTALSGLYSNQQGYIISYVNNALTVTPKALTVTGMSAANKVYDGSTTATLSGGSLSGLIGSETLGFSGTSAFADKNAGTAKAVTVTGITLNDGSGLASNYSITNPTGLSANITAKALTLSGMSAADKVYDGSTSATLSGGTLSGLVGSETLGFSGQSGVFADKNAGTAKAVNVSGITLVNGSGLASNYSIANLTGLTANITPKALTVTGISASNKVYDGTTTASLSGGALSGLIGSETLGFSGESGVFADANAGTAKAVTVSGITLADGSGLASNYSITNPTGLSANITPKALTFTGMSAADKVYDGSTKATLNGGSLSGLVGSETLGFSGQTGAFADADAGTKKDVTVTGTMLTNGSGLASNYSVANPAGLTADITALPSSTDTTGAQSAIASAISTSANLPSPANTSTNPGSSSSGNDSAPSGSPANAGSAPAGEYAPSPESGGPAGVDFTVVDAGANSENTDSQN